MVLSPSASGDQGEAAEPEVQSLLLTWATALHKLVIFQCYSISLPWEGPPASVAFCQALASHSVQMNPAFRREAPALIKPGGAHPGMPRRTQSDDRCPVPRAPKWGLRRHSITSGYTSSGRGGATRVSSGSGTFLSGNPSGPVAGMIGVGGSDGGAAGSVRGASASGGAHDHLQKQIADKHAALQRELALQVRHRHFGC